MILLQASKKSPFSPFIIILWRLSAWHTKTATATTIDCFFIDFFNGYWWKHLFVCECLRERENFIRKVTLKIPNRENNWHTLLLLLFCFSFTSNQINFMVWNVKKCSNFECNPMSHKKVSSHRQWKKADLWAI